MKTPHPQIQPTPRNPLPAYNIKWHDSAIRNSLIRADKSSLKLSIRRITITRPTKRRKRYTSKKEKQRLSKKKKEMCPARTDNEKIKEENHLLLSHHKMMDHLLKEIFTNYLPLKCHNNFTISICICLPQAAIWRLLTCILLIIHPCNMYITRNPNSTMEAQCRRSLKAHP